ncbi:probable WRKY transcription factor 70 [Lolium rigidum]|uniref:probable WRKY transcription factor 70 n=1 Tax=Lolium rigidum TaxID=89674 RepID=UPI001F5CD6C3|nr:probable WRKY transcription factor 70 [Lolium rigidum]
MDHSNINCSGHGAEIEALLWRQQELVTQLRALILPQLHDVDSGSAELALQLFDDVIGCNTSVVSKLFSARGGASFEPVDDKSLVRKNSTSTTTTTAHDDRMDERLEQQTMHSRSAGRKRRRNEGKRSRSLVTNVPDYDGHQWRKYGQKKINGSQHARSYYRCTFTERNCPATKTIQQQDKDGGSVNYSTDANGDEAAKYTVVYYSDHTCKASDIMSNNNIADHVPNLVDIDCPSTGKTEILTADITEWETELDVPALLEVFNNSLLNWEVIC